MRQFCCVRYLDEEEDWTRCPLGMYPGQRIESVELPAVQEVSPRKCIVEQLQSRNQDAEYLSSVTRLVLLI